MTKQISRRIALTTLTALALPTYSLEAQQAKTSSQTQVRQSIMYTTITQRPITKLGFKTINTEFALEKILWETLLKGMTQQEFYNAIKDSSMQSITTTLLKGVPIVHPGPINHEDLLEELQNGAKTFIRNRYIQLDSQLKFTRTDKKTLDKLLEKNLISSLTGTINPIRGDKKIYLFPPQSKIILTTSPQESSIRIQTNTNPKINPPTYQQTPTEIITGEQNKVFNNFFKFTILTKDSGVEDYFKKQAEEWGHPIKAPIDNFFRIYQKRKLN